MDGSMRTVLHSNGLVWPNGITLDYDAGRVYWVDASLDRIEYSLYDGSQRTVLRSGLSHPFGLTLNGDIVYWTDWEHNSVFSTRKLQSLGVQVVRDFLRGRPYGIEAVNSARQTSGECVDNVWLNVSEYYDVFFLYFLQLQTIAITTPALKYVY